MTEGERFFEFKPEQRTEPFPSAYAEFIDDPGPPEGGDDEVEEFWEESPAEIHNKIPRDDGDGLMQDIKWVYGFIAIGQRPAGSVPVGRGIAKENQDPGPQVKYLQECLRKMYGDGIFKGQDEAEIERKTHQAAIQVKPPVLCHRVPESILYRHQEEAIEEQGGITGNGKPVVYQRMGNIEKGFQQGFHKIEWDQEPEQSGFFRNPDFDPFEEPASGILF